MTYFAARDNRFYHTPVLPQTISIHENLPVGTYSLKSTPKGEIYYEPITSFTLPPVLYGDVVKQRDRILQTFINRPSSTGVMLVGEQGSGKTLLAKALSVTAAATYDVPTIVINAPWRGEEFNTLVQQIRQPCIFLFDEFEKVYNDEEQEELLTLLDGVYPSKKLFVITSNDKWRVNKHMRNRPGRIFYYLEFGTLELSFVQEYSQRNLLDKTQVQSVMFVANVFVDLNFDMLKALIEEMNRFGEPAHAAIRMLNARPEFGANQDYDLKMLRDDVEIVADCVSMNRWTGNPTNSQIELYTRSDATKRWEDRFFFTTDHLKSIADGNFIFVQKNHQMVLTRAKLPRAFEYHPNAF